MRKVRLFLNLSLYDKYLFCASFLLCGIARAAVRLFNYRRIAFYYGHFWRMTVASTLISTEQQRLAWKIHRNIKLAAKYTPWNSNCLAQAITAKFWCQHYNIPYMFFIGLSKSNDTSDKGHAWLTAGPIAITGGDSLKTHCVILSYSSFKLLDKVSS